MDLPGLSASGTLLLGGVALDAVFGDPRYRQHPVRLMGRSLTFFEKALRQSGADGYAGGCLLFILLAVTWILVPCAIVSELYDLNYWLGSAAHLFLVYSLLALRDLYDHVWAVHLAADRGDLNAVHTAIARLVGRDTGRMDLRACRRAAIESLAENFVDGYLSAIFWYVILGLPGLLFFKIASTMDSMVGYKTPRYLRFGWFGARLDDLLNYLPARICWALFGICALPFPSLSAAKGWQVGLQQHSIIPGPNPGWSEATMAGVLQRRLIGPIWKGGSKVTDLWVGVPSDPEGGERADLLRAICVVMTAAGAIVLVVLLSLGF
jgi:adenosylcobinamide-phosphate synthase